jgi:hypothetical protein
MTQAILVVLLFQARHTHGADPAIVFRQRKSARLEFCNPTILDLRRDPAARARMAIGIADGSDRAGVSHG